MKVTVFLFMPRSSSPVRTPGSHPGNHGFESHTRYEEKAINCFGSFFILEMFKIRMGFEGRE